MDYALTCSQKVQTNAQWSNYSYDLSKYDFGTGDAYISIRWTFSKSGNLIRLEGNDNENIAVGFKGNFSGLNGHRFLVQGIRYY